MNLGSGRRDELDVNVTPLIDVVFLLLIFFMVSTTFERESEIEIMLPQAAASAAPTDDFAMQVTIDHSETIQIDDPLLFTVANLTQYGADLRITTDAEPDDGYLELIIARKQDTPWLLGNVMQLARSALSELPKVIYRKFQHLRVERKSPGMIQIDGELVEAPAVVEITVNPKCLNVLVPIQID